MKRERAGGKQSKPELNPATGNFPVLQYIAPADLSLDHTYQRSTDAGPSRSLIRAIAKDWNWRLCLPLVVSRRDDHRHFVIDGQHRLEAALLRGDIPHLPCVVVQYADAIEEAADFVRLNQQRRPLKKIDLFKAALASGDEESLAIMEAISQADLAIAPHENFRSWKPGMISNIGGVQAAWRKHGGPATAAALECLSAAFKNEILRFAGTVFPGIVAVCAQHPRTLDADRFSAMLAAKGQEGWRTAISLRRAQDTNLNFSRAAEAVISEAWSVEVRGDLPASKPAGFGVVNKRAFVTGGRAWCDQCERCVTVGEAEVCASPFCKIPRMETAK